MSAQFNHPPRPGVRRFVMEAELDTVEKRREFAAAVRAIGVCGLAAEIHPNTWHDPTFTLYAVRRVRSSRDEK